MLHTAEFSRQSRRETASCRVGAGWRRRRYHGAAQFFLGGRCVNLQLHFQQIERDAEANREHVLVKALNAALLLIAAMKIMWLAEGSPLGCKWIVRNISGVLVGVSSAQVLKTSENNEWRVSVKNARDALVNDT